MPRFGSTMILAYHFILSAYGFWLPNDPRGSWSEFVANWELFRYGGPATHVGHTESVAGVPHDRECRLRAKDRIKHSPVLFTEKQALAISKGFARASREGSYDVYACAILPEHCHLIIGRHDRDVGVISSHLKSHATRQLKSEGHWTHEHSPWGVKYWAVFIDEERWVNNAINYVHNNPVKEGKPLQNWSFVKNRNGNQI